MTKQNAIATAAKARKGSLRQTPGNTILLVEDEDIVRALAKKVLEATGFIVFEASSIESARKIWQKRHQEIDLLLADVLLPDGSSKQIGQEFQREKPQLHVIFTSGYGEDIIEGNKTDVRCAGFVQKPFHPRELIKVIQKAFEKNK